jgi:hypothetical protein
LQKGQTIVFPRIVVGFFGIEAVVNYDVQGRFLHDRDFGLSHDTALRCYAAVRESVRTWTARGIDGRAKVDVPERSGFVHNPNERNDGIPDFCRTLAVPDGFWELAPASLR